MSTTLFKGNVPRFPRTTPPTLRDMLVPQQFATLEAATTRARDEAMARGQWMYVYSLLLPDPGEAQKLVLRTLRRYYYVYPGGPAFHVDMWHHASLSPHTCADTTAEGYVPAPHHPKKRAPRVPGAAPHYRRPAGAPPSSAWWG